jgi:hypothetical protein
MERRHPEGGPGPSFQCAGAVQHNPNAFKVCGSHLCLLKQWPDAAVPASLTGELRLEIGYQCRTPAHYLVFWSIMSDAELSAAAKCVATVLLLQYRNHKTGQCNPSFGELAMCVGRTNLITCGEICEEQCAEGVNDRGKRERHRTVVEREAIRSKRQNDSPK